jgi:hypothetical protein
MLGWLSDDGSPYAALQLLYWSSAFGLLVVQAFLLRFPRGARASHALREVVWALVPAFLLVWLGLLSHRTSTEILQGPQVAFEVSSVDDRDAR